MKKLYIKGLGATLLVISLVCISGHVGYAADAGRQIKKELPRSGKTSAPISVSYSVPSTNAINDKVQVIVTIKPLSDAQGLSLRLTTGEGLTMQAGEFNKNYGDQQRNTALSEAVIVTPSVEGVLYLNVFVTGTFNGKQMTRAGAVPINVGSSSQKMLKKSGHSVTDAKGQKIIIMPAEEKK